METFLFFPLRFRRAYDSAYDSDFHYVSDHDSESDSVASENQPLGLKGLKRLATPLNWIIYERNSIILRTEQPCHVSGTPL